MFILYELDTLETTLKKGEIINTQGQEGEQTMTTK